MISPITSLPTVGLDGDRIVAPDRLFVGKLFAQRTPAAYYRVVFDVFCGTERLGQVSTTITELARPNARWCVAKLRDGTLDKFDVIGHSLAGVEDAIALLGSVM